MTAGYKPDHWDAVRTGEREEEPLPTMESIYRGKCPDGDRCLHGCHRNERCYHEPHNPAGGAPSAGGGG